MIHHGLEFHNILYSELNPHFANPFGFFATMAKENNGKSFSIEFGKEKFWIDFSQGKENPEEETNSEDVARRLEELSESAIKTKINFLDLEKIQQIQSEQIRLATIMLKMHGNCILQTQNIYPKETAQSKPNYFG
jgi:Ser-tRNA(Ala) deacylase AlaX